MKFFQRRSTNNATKAKDAKSGGRLPVRRATTAAAVAVSPTKSTGSTSPTGTVATTKTSGSTSSNRNSVSQSTPVKTAAPAASAAPRRSTNPFAGGKSAAAVATASTGKNPFAPNANSKNPFATSNNSKNPFATSNASKATDHVSIQEILAQLEDDDYVDDELDVDEMCRRIVDFLRSAMSDVDVEVDDLVDAARALRMLAMADDSDFDGYCFTKAGVEVLLEVMEAYSDVPLFQREACLALEALAAWEENQDLIAHRGHVAAILAVLDSSRAEKDENDVVDDEDKEVASACLGIFCYLSKHHGNELTDTVPSILQILRHSKDDAQLYRRGCWALANTTNGTSIKSRSSQQQLSKQQGIAVVLKALTNPQFADDIEIHAGAMQVLEHVASHPSVEVKGKIVMQGGIDRIVECLQRNTVLPAPGGDASPSFNGSHHDEGKDHAVDENESEAPTKRTISVSALQTLANLSRDGSADETKRQMGKAVKAILKTMRQHPHNAPLQVSGLEALRNLASLHAESVLAQGGVSTVLMAMMQHPEETALQYQACGALTNLFVASRMASQTNNSGSPSRGNPITNDSSKDVNLNYDLIHSMASEDGLTIIFRTVRLHQANLHVQEQAFGALFFLSCSQDYLTPQQREQLCLEENIFVLLGTMNQYIRQSELLCQRGCGLILNLSFVSPISQDIVASVGGIKVLLAAMRRHGLNVDIQTFGAGCLAGLSLDPNHHDEFVNEEGISTVLAAMMIHPGHPTIQAYGCDVLSNVASSSRTYKQTILDGNARAVATDALTKHKMHKGVQTRGAILLRALS
jgi:hypothetical protein